MEKCQRCGKEVEATRVVTVNIIYRDREMKWDSWKKKMVSKAVVKSKAMRFCSGECAHCEQCAHEG